MKNKYNAPYISIIEMNKELLDDDFGGESHPYDPDRAKEQIPDMSNNWDDEEDDNTK